MKVVLKALLQTFWVVVFFVAAMITKSTIAIIGLGAFGFFYSFGLGIARQVLEGVERRLRR